MRCSSLPNHARTKLAYSELQFRVNFHTVTEQAMLTSSYLKQVDLLLRFLMSDKHKLKTFEHITGTPATPAQRECSPILHDFFSTNSLFQIESQYVTKWTDKWARPTMLSIN